MKICIPAEAASPDSPVDGRFGRAFAFVIFDDENGTHEILENSFRNGSGGVGPKVVQMISSHGVTHLIAPQLGGNADEAIKAAGIVFIPCKPGESVRSLYTSWKAGNLSSS